MKVKTLKELENGIVNLLLDEGLVTPVTIATYIMVDVEAMVEQSYEDGVAEGKRISTYMRD